MRNILILYGILHLWLALKLSYNEAVEFKFTNAVCESYNKSWFVLHKCRLRAVNRDKTTLHLNGTVLHPAYDIFVKAQILKKANGYKPWLYNMNIDVCRFLKKPYNPVAILIFKMFKEFSNFNHTCPYMVSIAFRSIGPGYIQVAHSPFLRSSFLFHERAHKSWMDFIYDGNFCQIFCQQENINWL
ncbi:uncharacterized protein LOC115762361 [Drosophila novamexicana]|uniref:uncharacterized protein LOC115762361 n=1 Tax=Drosophila novamexicana TaxID=47314 RepID=UPI0011E5C672|nr:uncharacterized protein LOC115762361 [Drosophila novamexicana]